MRHGALCMKPPSGHRSARGGRPTAGSSPRNLHCRLVPSARCRNRVHRMRQRWNSQASGASQSRRSS
jgi:hypothetical protein